MTQPGGASPDPIFRVAQGFMAAKYLFAASELGIFAAIPEDGCELPALAGATGLPQRTLRIVADALVALELLRREGARYLHTPATWAFLSRRAPADVSPFLRFWDRLSYRGWTDFARAVRTDQVGIGGVAPTEEELQILFEGIAGVTAQSAIALGEAYDFGAHERLLDLGGGTGSFIIHLARRYPKLRGTFFDIAPAIGAAKLAEAGLGDRFAVVEGDFFADPIPGGHDAILISSVMHVYRPAQNVLLLERARQAAPRGARLLLLDYWLSPERTAPLFNVLMAGEFLVVEGGDSYSAEQARGWLREAGWRFDSQLEVGGPATVLVATAE